MDKLINSNRTVIVFARRGFTLIEVLVVVAVLAIMSCISMPSFLSYLKNNQVQVIQKTLFTTIRSARLHAITNAQNIVICASDNQVDCVANSFDANVWSDGWIVFADLNNNKKRDAETENILIVHTNPKSQTILWNRGGSLTYSYEGLVNLNGSFYICSEHTTDQSASRAIIINRAGRPYQSNKTASDTQIIC